MDGRKDTNRAEACESGAYGGYGSSQVVVLFNEARS
jgi:hypothetical protein